MSSSCLREQTCRGGRAKNHSRSNSLVVSATDPPATPPVQARGGAGGGVKPQAVKDKLLAIGQRGLARPAQDRPDARDQLLRAERLGTGVTGAHGGAAGGV